MPRTITVASQKGGVGKTTTVVNLAASLCLAGKKVLLLDLDPQANATSGVGGSRLEGGEEGGAYLSALLNESPVKPFIRPTGVENLWLLPSASEAADLEMIQRLISRPARRLRRHMGRSTKNFDFLLIDCPPSLGGPPTVALYLSDAVIIPIQCEYYAMEGLSQILPVIQEIKKKQNRDLEVEGLLLTMFSRELELSHEVVDEVKGYFGDRTFRTIVPRDVTLAEAASHGEPAVRYAPLARGTWSYLDLAREILKEN